MTKKDFQKQIEELTGSWKRALADYQNLQKRYEKEKSEFSQYVNSILICKLLPILDNFAKVQGYLKDEGLGLAIRGFEKVLAEEGLEEIETEGKVFNPEEMEATEATEGEEGKVVGVVAKGYRLKKKVIQPAKVKIGRTKKEKTESESVKDINDINKGGL